MKFFRFLGICLCVLSFVACKQEPVHKTKELLDKDLLKGWAEKIIIPAYNNYQSKAIALNEAAQNFKKDPTSSTLDKLKTKWEDAYVAFQKVMIFDFNSSARTFFLEVTNTYPTVVDSPDQYHHGIEQNIQLVEQGKGSNIVLAPSANGFTYGYQGFPALDYLLFGPNKNLAYYQTHQAARTYIQMLTEQMVANINYIVTDWKQTKDQYSKDTDTSVQGSFSATVNALIRVYEKQIRAFKVGYAAGSIREQAGKANPTVIEAYYKGDISKKLLKEALRSSQNFFNGTSFDGSTKVKGLKDVLIENGDKQLAEAIDAQYQKMYDNIDNMKQSLKDAALTNQPRMQALYNVIQVNVFNYKTKMMAALNVQPDYLDTDGD